MMKQPSIERMIDFVESRQIDQIVDYMQRGARFAPLSDDDLVAQWLTALSAMADAPLDQSCYAGFVDVEAEMNLRNIVPPRDRGRPELERWMAATDIAIQAFTRDPEQRSELTERMIAEWLAFDGACIRSN